MDQRLWYQQDANFNVTSVSNDVGAVVERYVYAPYGERTVLHSDFTPVASNLSLFGVDEGHQGLTADAETGLVQNRHRYLHVTLGRFTSTDPLGYADGLNHFRYVRGNPLVWLDPAGLFPGPVDANNQPLGAPTPPGAGGTWRARTGDEQVRNHDWVPETHPTPNMKKENVVLRFDPGNDKSVPHWDLLITTKDSNGKPISIKERFTPDGFTVTPTAPHLKTDVPYRPNWPDHLTPKVPDAGSRLGRVLKGIGGLFGALDFLNGQESAKEAGASDSAAIAVGIVEAANPLPVGPMDIHNAVSDLNNRVKEHRRRRCEEENKRNAGWLPPGFYPTGGDSE
jgi:RHS repeat-associated protein